MNNSLKTLTIIGNVAAGKSSVMELITSTLKGEAVYADNLFQTTDPFRDCYLEDITRWALTNETWLTLMRSRMLREAKQNQKKEWLVVDSGLLMSWVYTHSHFLAGRITQAEWDLYKELYCDLTGDLYKNMYVVYLDYSLNTLMYRLKVRGRDFELVYYTRDYLSQLQAGLASLVESLEKQDVPVIRVSESEVPDFVTNDSDKASIASIILGTVNGL